MCIAAPSCGLRLVKLSLSVGLALFLSASCDQLRAQTWNLNANGTWGVAGNWSPAAVPNAVDATASLGAIITANRVVTLAAPVTLGTLSINDNNRYTITGSTMTFDVSAGTAAITAQGSGGAGDGHAINSAISLNDDLLVTRLSGGNLDINGAIANNGNAIRVSSQTVVRLDGAISGGGGLTAEGPGVVTIGGTSANSFTGITSVTDGQLNLSKSTSVMAVGGSLVIGDGVGAPASARVVITSSEQIANTSAVSLGSDAQLTLNASRSETIGSLSASSSAASVVLSAGSTLTVGSGSAPAGSFQGVISGAGAFRKAGTGSMVLSGNNSYTGATSVLAGVLTIQNASALGTSAGSTTVSSGAQLQIDGGLAVAENFSIAGTGVSGTGALRGLSGNSTLSGSIVRSASATIQNDAGLLTLSGAQTGNNTLTVSGAGNTTIAGNISGSTSAIVVKTGPGTLELSGAKTYAGRTEINGGTLRISADNNLGTAPGAATAGHLRFGGGTLDTTADMTLHANRRITLNAGGGTFDPNAGTTLTYAGVISGTGRLTKTDAGTMRVSGGAGSNTYSGGTTVSGGTLALAKTAGQNAVGAGAVLLNSGGTLLLENANQIGDATALTLAGGTFSTGTGYSETLGVLTLTSDSSISLGAAIHNLRFGASNLAAWTPGAKLTIFGWSGTGGFAGTAGKIFFGSSDTALTSAQLSGITFDGHSGAQLLANGELVPMAVPEARTVLTALLLVALFIWREGRRLTLGPGGSNFCGR